MKGLRAHLKTVEHFAMREIFFPVSAGAALPPPPPLLLSAEEGGRAAGLRGSP